jgi:hypothetical protein
MQELTNAYVALEEYYMTASVRKVSAVFVKVALEWLEGVGAGFVRVFLLD